MESAKNPDGLELTIQQDENSLSSLLGSEGAPIVVEVKGEELDEIAQLTEEVKERMIGVNGIYDVITSVEDGAPEVVISIDRTIAGINNLSVAMVIEQLKQQLSGKEVGKMEYRGEMRDIVIKVPDIPLSSLVLCHQKWNTGICITRDCYHYSRTSAQGDSAPQSKPYR